MTSENVTFVPVTRMLDRARLARDESDTAYFFDLLYLGEMTLKFLVAELTSGVEDDRARHRYALEYRLLRADGIGEWTEVLDEVLIGPTSQHLVFSVRDSQRALSMTIGANHDSWQRRAVDRLNDASRCLDSDLQDSSGQKVSLRTWARQSAWLRNRTRGHGSPKAATLSTVCPALSESLNEILANAPAFCRNWAYLNRNLSGKFRVSVFSGVRDPFEHLTRDATYSMKDGAYVDLGELRRVSLVHTDPDLADFFLPNGNYRKERFETLSYITDERRSEDGSDWSLPVEAQPGSETSGDPALDVVGEVFTNMPPPRDGYVARPKLESELREVLVDSRNPVVTLQGRGGVGKTSLALSVLHEFSNSQDFFAFVWFSARDIDLLPEGPKIVRANVVSTDDVARDFADLMRPSDGLKSKEALQYLRDCLSGQAPDGPFIFVFDNFETIREQAHLYGFVNNAIRLPNKVLITTRTRDFKADYPIEVSGMNREEYHSLVDETTSRLDIRSIVDSSYEDRLYDESDGHPYITKVLLGEVAREGRQVSLKRVVATKDAVLDALFDRSFAGLSPAAQRVFLTLCCWRSYVPKLGLEAVLLRPGSERMDVDGALAELEKSSLVEHLHDASSDSTFLSVPLAAALFGKRKLVSSPLKVAIDADMELVRAFGPMTVADVPLGLKPRLDRLTRAISERLGTAFEAEEELAVLEYIATGHPPAWLNLAALQQETGDVAGALRSLNRYIELQPRDQAAWRTLIGLYRGLDDPLGEMHARLQLAELARPPFDELSMAAARLSGMLSRREIELEADERRLMVGRLRSLMEARSDEADATDLSRLAWLCMHVRDVDAADRWALAGLTLEPENEHCLGIRRRVAANNHDS